jgi:predicted MPP superfamily phosphohydrolase
MSPKDPGSTILTRRRFIVGAAAAAGLSLYSYGPARHHLGVLRHDVYIPGLPPAFHNFTIVQLSDFHFGPFNEVPVVQHAVDIVNSLNPNAVALTGDFITANTSDFSKNAPSANACAAVLRNLRAPLRFASLGNHDTVDIPGVTRALKSNGITVLNNQHVPVDLHGDRLWFAGLADVFFDTPRPDIAIPRAKPEEPVILLGHEPDYADSIHDYTKISRRHVDLMLCGHTHGGQVNLPLVSRVMLPAYGRKYVHGPFQLGSTLLYVNRGLGTIHLPIRFNCPPEITLFTLYPDKV